MKFYLKRIRLNQGGYTDRGRYYGSGMPLFEYEDAETGDISDVIRAYDREDAKLLIRCKNPEAIFYK